MFVHDGGEAAQVPLLDRLFALIAELLDLVQVIDHAAIAAARLLILFGQNRRGRAREAGEEQQEVVFEVVEGLAGKREGRYIHASIPAEFEGGDAAKRRDVLILFSDRFAQQVDFNMAGLLRQNLPRHEILIQRPPRHAFRVRSGVTMHFDSEILLARGHRGLRFDWSEARRCAAGRHGHRLL